MPKVKKLSPIQTPVETLPQRARMNTGLALCTPLFSGIPVCQRLLFSPWKQSSHVGSGLWLFRLLLWLRGKDTGDMGSIPGSGRSPGEGNGNPLQYFCLGYPTYRRAWWVTVHGIAESQTWLSTHPYHSCLYCNGKSDTRYSNLVRKRSFSICIFEMHKIIKRKINM